MPKGTNEAGKDLMSAVNKKKKAATSAFFEQDYLKEKAMQAALRERMGRNDIFIPKPENEIPKVVQDAKEKSNFLVEAGSYIWGKAKELKQKAVTLAKYAKAYAINGVTVYIPQATSNAYKGSMLQSAVNKTKYGLKKAAGFVKDGALKTAGAVRDVFDVSVNWIDRQYQDSALQRFVNRFKTEKKEEKKEKGWFAKKLESVGKAMKKAGSWISEKASKLKKGAENKLESIFQSASNSYRGSKLQKAVKNTKGFFITAGNYLTNKAKKFGSFVADKAIAAGKAIATPIKNAYKGSLLQMAVNESTDKLERAGKWVSKKAHKAVGKINDAIKWWNKDTSSLDYEGLDIDQEVYQKMRASLNKEYANNLKKFRESIELYKTDFSQELDHDVLRDSDAQKKIQEMRDSFKVNDYDVFYNIAIRSNVGRLREQLENDEGKGLGSFELHDLTEDGKDIQGSAPTQGFSQNLNKDNLGMNLMEDGPAKSDAPTDIQIPDNGQLTMDEAIKLGKDLSEQLSTILSNVKTYESLAPNIKTAINALKYLASDDPDAEFKSASNVLGDKLFNASLDLKKLSATFGAMGLAKKLADGKQLTAAETYTLATNPIKTYNLVDKYVGTGNGIRINISDKAIKAADILSITDGIKKIYEGINKVIETNKDKKALEDFKNSDEKGKGQDLKKNAVDKQFGRMIFDSITARDQKYNTDQIDNSFAIFAGALDVVKGGTGVGGLTSVAGNVSSAALYVPMINSTVDYIKKTFFDDKALYIQDIWGGQENYEAAQKKFNLSATDLDKEVLYQTDCPSISDLANRVRAEMAEQIASNYNKGFERGSDEYVKAAKLLDKSGKMDTQNVYQLLGGDGHLENILKGRQAKDIRSRVSLNELLGEEKPNNKEHLTKKTEFIKKVKENSFNKS